MFYYEMINIKSVGGNLETYNYAPFEHTNIVNAVYNLDNTKVVFKSNLEVAATSNILVLTEQEYLDKVKVFDEQKPVAPPPPLTNEQLSEQNAQIILALVTGGLM